MRLGWVTWIALGLGVVTLAVFVVVFWRQSAANSSLRSHVPSDILGGCSAHEPTHNAIAEVSCTTSGSASPVTMVTYRLYGTTAKFNNAVFTALFDLGPGQVAAILPFPTAFPFERFVTM